MSESKGYNIHQALKDTFLGGRTRLKQQNQRHENKPAKTTAKVSKVCTTSLLPTFFVLCFVFCVLCFVFSVFCFLFSVFCFLFSVFCFIFVMFLIAFCCFLLFQLGRVQFCLVSKVSLSRNKPLPVPFDRS